MKSSPPRRKCSIRPVVIGIEIAEYMNSLKRRNYSPKSIDTYHRALVDMDAFLDKTGIRRVEDVTAKILSDYRLSLVERGFKTSSMAVYIRALRGLFKYLESQRRIFINPAAGIIVREQQRAIQRVPTEQEVRALLSAPDTSRPCGLRDRAILETAYASGARRSELAGIQLDGVDLSERTVRLMGKGRRERIVPLTISAATWIGRYIENERSQFPGSDAGALWLGHNGPLSANAISSIFYAQSRASGVEPVIRPHAMRRACATHMLSNGASPIEIQQLLGHTCLKHLSQYLAVSMVELKQAHDNSRLGA